MTKVDFVYSNEFENIIREHLSKNSSSRITIHEWRNFVDYDMIPIYKKLKEAELNKNENKRSN